MKDYSTQLLNAIIVLKDNYIFDDDEKLKEELGIDDEMWEELSRYL